MASVLADERDRGAGFVLACERAGGAGVGAAADGFGVVRGAELRVGCSSCGA